MSDSQLSAEHPVFPPPRTDGEPEEPTSDEAQETATDEPQPTTYEIDGKSYTADQIEEAMRGQMRQDDYTRKTQALADERRALEAEKERLRVEAEARRSAVPGDDPWNEVEEINSGLAKVLRGLDSRIATLDDRLRSQDERAVKEANEDRLLKQALDAWSDKPGFDRTAVLQFMRENALDPVQFPEHVGVAYRAINGFNHGRMLGERAAVERGANVAPVMGASGTSVSPGFTHPTGIPGAQRPIEDTSWADLARAAEADPEI